MSQVRKRRSRKRNLSANHKGKHKSINVKKSEQAERVRLRTIIGMIKGNTSKKRPSKPSKQWLDNEISFPSTPWYQLVDYPIILEALTEGILKGTELYQWNLRSLKATPYNVILGRTGLRSLRAVASTIHSMVKFPTANRIATMTTKSETLHEFQRMEEAQGKLWVKRVLIASLLDMLSIPRHIGNEHKVCKLVKSLYGLKQAPKQWHQKFDEVVLSSGFLLNQSDKCIYSKFDSSGEGVIICLYVDDMLIFGTDRNQVDKTKKFLSSKFSMKDMGEADIILGIKIKRKNKEIVITKSHYIEKILKKFNREDCSPVSTPMDPVKKLKPDTSKLVDQLKYSRAIGCLMYDMTSTRPAIAYAVGRLRRFTNSSSTSGWVFLLGGGVISWDFKKQTCITGSTMEYEFVALAAAGKEAEWLRNLIHEIPKSDKAGKLLAEVLIKGLQGNRPVTLVGFSLGARAIFKCLQHLAETGNDGLVERVVLLGAPVSIQGENWGAVRKVVSGRFINAFSTNDWMLGVAFRASLLSQGLAGIQSVNVPGIENVDVTEIIEGHSSYLWATQEILDRLELESYFPVFTKNHTKD
nr:zinc finger, CCHC-type [Tanacetum cinerariifolium]